MIEALLLENKFPLDNTYSGMTPERKSLFILLPRHVALVCKKFCNRLLSMVDIVLATLLCSSSNPTYDHANVPAREIIITCSISLCPVESVWSSTSLWKKNFILHSWQIHIAFKSYGCMYVSNLLQLVQDAIVLLIYELINFIHSFCSNKSLQIQYDITAPSDTPEQD